MPNKNCYLCPENASIETVESEGGERFDVLCSGECPRYEISRIAIEKLEGNENRQIEAKAEIHKISESGKYPVIRYNVTNGFVYTSKEDEQ